MSQHNGKTAAERLASRLAPPVFAAPGEKTPTAPPEPSPTARTKRVRHTLDLAVARHHALKAWCGELAVVFGRAEVPAQHVLDELVGLLLTDETTARKVRDALRKRYDEA